jgi:putative hydrolase of HD superfamily
MIGERLKRQLDFIIEIDKLKHVLRRTLTIDDDRHENDAEHSWHLATMAVLLAEHATGEPVDVSRVVRMVLVHDIVEIDAGDTYCYSDADPAEKLERETRAALRLFELLPADQTVEVRALWDEFEGRTTPEARYANALDRLQPLLLNYHTDGKTWLKHGVTRAQVLERARPIKESIPALWEVVEDLVERAVRNGILGA